MPTKVPEIRQDHRGDRRQCPICSPTGPDRITLDRLWAWSQAHPGELPFKDQERRG